jgi:hypothetical protein
MKTNFNLFIADRDAAKKNGIHEVPGMIFTSEHYTLPEVKDALLELKNWIMVPYNKRTHILMTSEDGFDKNVIENYFYKKNKFSRCFELY